MVLMRESGVMPVYAFVMPSLGNTLSVSASLPSLTSLSIAAAQNALDTDARRRMDVVDTLG
jgi:hypothetical protein